MRYEAISNYREFRDHVKASGCDARTSDAGCEDLSDLSQCTLLSIADGANQQCDRGEPQSILRTATPNALRKEASLSLKCPARRKRVNQFGQVRAKSGRDQFCLG
jgi:hypothetical protein